MSLAYAYGHFRFCIYFDCIKQEGTGKQPNKMKKNWSFPDIIIATGNINKLKQFQELFSGYLHLDVKGLKDLPEMPEIIEDQDTFEGNARKKAEIISQKLQAPVVSDDSGLVVPALNGEPGVYSARYAGEDATDEENNRKLLQRIAPIPPSQRKAYYVCAMALAIPDEQTKIVQGKCEGVIVSQPKGNQGFGYDPIFFLPSHMKTMAELSNQQKFAISHRGKATRLLIEEMQKAYHFKSEGGNHENITDQRLPWQDKTTERNRGTC